MFLPTIMDFLLGNLNKCFFSPTFDTCCYRSLIPFRLIFSLKESGATLICLSLLKVK